MRPLVFRVYRDFPPALTIKPRKKCVTANCAHDALANWPYCDDCDVEIKHRYPGIWQKRTRDTSREPS